MCNADKPTGIIGQALELAGEHERLHLGPALPVSGKRAGPGTMQEYDRGPARGMVLALAPAVVTWAVLIGLLIRL